MSETVSKTDKQDIANKALVKLIQGGDKAAEERLCKQNIGFVREKALGLYGSAGSDLELCDLMQEGFLGLLKAARKMDLSYENTFLTYAGFWVIQYMIRANTWEGHLIRLPDSVLYAIKKLTKLDDEFSYLPMGERKNKIADEMRCSIGKVEYLYQVSEFVHYTSFEKPVDEENNGKLGDNITYPNAPDFAEELVNGTVTEHLEKALSTLTEREQEIIRRRCGYYTSGDPETLEEIGKDYGVSKDRIRQIEAKGLRKLRHPTRFKMLKDYA